MQQPVHQSIDEVAATRPSRRGPKAVRSLLTLAAAAALVTAGGGAGAAIALHYGGKTTASEPASPSSQGKDTSATSQEALARAAAVALPSVVTIIVTTSSGTGEGSGVILRSDGSIVTNNHVIEAAADGAGAIRVVLADGRSATAEIVGQDPAADLAVIRAVGVSGVAPARIGTSSALHVGDTVAAVGSPLGLSGTVTSGIVSALHRTITAGRQGSPYGGQAGQSGGTTESLTDVIQTDTAINPGNSGGALVDDTGRLIGITTAIASLGGGYVGQQSGSIGLGFAIPISTAYSIAIRLMAAR